MNKSLITGIVIGVLVVTSGGVLAGFDLFDRRPQFAQVVDVDPVAENVRTPREVCADSASTRQGLVNDDKGKSVTGTACSIVYDSSERIVGYDVRYRLGNEEGTVRMSNHPGPRIKVKDREPVRS